MQPVQEGCFGVVSPLKRGLHGLTHKMFSYVVQPVRLDEKKPA